MIWKKWRKNEKELILCQAKPIPEKVTTKKRHESCFKYIMPLIFGFGVQWIPEDELQLETPAQLFAHKQQKYTTYQNSNCILAQSKPHFSSQQLQKCLAQDIAAVQIAT